MEIAEIVPALAWYELDAAHSRVSHKLSTALRRQHSLSLNSHAVLAQLMRAPDHKLRMTEIANLIGFSLSGLTGLIGRLEQEGLVERQSNFADRRVIFAKLTDLGERYAREASKMHEETLNNVFSKQFAPDELDQLIQLLNKLSRGSAEASKAAAESGAALTEGMHSLRGNGSSAEF
jgi:DNA-binding MarR family transcriptional regulator